MIPASGMSLSGILEAGTEGLFQTHIGLGEEGGFEPGAAPRMPSVDPTSWHPYWAARQGSGVVTPVLLEGLWEVLWV